MKDLNTLSPKEEEKLLLEELEIRKGLEDHFYFCKYHLGYADLVRHLHGEISHSLEAPTKKKELFLLPRGSFKSTHVTIGYPIWKLAKNPDLRFLIGNEVYNNSKAFLREIKGHMDNDELLEKYPNLTPNKRTPEGWTENSVILENRSREYKESSISCAGLDQIKVGMHYDEIIMDDLVSPKNITSPEQIAKVVDYYRYALSLLEPGGRLIIIGTRYHYNDLYGYILEQENDNFGIMIKPAINEYGHLLFPERLTDEFLQEQRKAQGTYIYNCQYMLNPVDEDSADFRREWLIKYNGKLVERGDKRVLRVEWTDQENFKADGVYEVPIEIYGLMDPASKKKKRTDWTVIIIVAVNLLKNEWYILDMIRDKLNPKERVDAVFDMYHKWHFKAIGIESVGFQDTIKFYCVQKMKEDGVFFNIREVNTGNKSKIDRILSLQPRFQNGAVFIPRMLRYTDYTKRSFNLTDLFEDEYAFFPVAKSDDIMDCLAFGEIIIVRKRDRGRRIGKARIISGGRPNGRKTRSA